VLLRLSYIALTGMVTFLRLLPMSSTDKNIEILTLRHQLAVLQRQASRPRFSPADRAFLAALLHRFPRPMLRQLHLIVSPDTILRWHRTLLRRHHARRSRPKRPGLLHCAELEQPRSLIEVGQITRASSSKAARIRRFTVSSAPSS
jgi:putative transposase